MSQAGQSTRWGLVWLAILAGVVGAFHIGKAPPAIPEIRAELGLSFTTAGWIISVISATGLVVPLLAGTMTDWLGHRRTVLMGLACGAGGSLLGSLAAGAPLLLLSRGLEGLGYIIIAVAAPSLVAQLSFGGARRMALGIWGAYMPAGASIMMFASPLLLVNFGWQALWQGIAGLTLLWLIIMWWFTRGEEQLKHVHISGDTSLLHDARQTMKKPGPWLLALTFALYTLQFTPLVSWLPTMLEEDRGLSTASAATLTALVFGVNVIGNVTAGWLLKKGVARWLILTVTGLGMGLCALGIFAEGLDDTTRYSLCLMYSMVGGMLPAAVIAAAPVFAPSPRQIGLLNGMIVQGANTGMLIGPPLAGLIKEMTGGWESAAQFMVATSAGIMVVALILRGIERPLSAASSSTA